MTPSRRLVVCSWLSAGLLTLAGCNATSSAGDASAGDGAHGSDGASPDSGVQDSGTHPADSGTPRDGSTGTDAGTRNDVVVPSDTGVGTDSGTPIDVVNPADTGTAIDTGVPDDTGTPDDTGAGDTDAGSGSTDAGSPVDSGGPADPCPGLAADTTAYHPGVNSITAPIDAWQTLPGLIYLPDDYGTAGHCYPLVIFAHGSGEAGTDTTALYINGPFHFIQAGNPMQFTNPADGQPYKFIVLALQAPSWSVMAGHMVTALPDVVARFPVDISRIYATGLSAGGDLAYNMPEHAGENNQPQISAEVPMSAAAVLDDASLTAIVNNGIGVWGFGSPSDVHGNNTQMALARVIAAAPQLGRFTSYDGGHCCWNNFYDPNYRENINGTMMNIYEWMLTYRHAP